jgi:phosphate transport system permease protein
MTQRRQAVNVLARGVMYLGALVALIPLTLLLAYVVLNGLPAASHLDFYLNAERPVGIPGSGVAHALVGTVEMVSVASLMAIPVGVVSGIHLVEYGHARWASWVRTSCDVLVGAPSIAIGLFAYALVVAPLRHFSALSASVALAVLMLPVVIRTTEAACVLIPNSLRESGLALGLPRARVALQLLLPAAAPGVVTGCLLAIARAAGETAPLLFTALGNRVFTLDPTHAMSALPLIVFHNALTPYPELQAQAWGAALLLVVLVLSVNLLSRFVLRRQIALASLRP